MLIFRGCVLQYPHKTTCLQPLAPAINLGACYNGCCDGLPSARIRFKMGKNIYTSSFEHLNIIPKWLKTNPHWNLEPGASFFEYLILTDSLKNDMVFPCVERSSLKNVTLLIHFLTVKPSTSINSPFLRLPGNLPRIVASFRGWLHLWEFWKGG